MRIGWSSNFSHKESFMQKILRNLHEKYGGGRSIEELAQIEIDINDDVIKEKLMEILKEAYEERMPFNKFLGVKIEVMTENLCKVRIDKKPELVGNFEQNILHGGVISSVIDLTGGIAIQMSALSKMGKRTIGEFLVLFAKMSTIDMRVDYLRPGTGEYFVCSAYLMRSGKKVAVTRMEFHNNRNQLIATGSGAYMVG